MIVNFADKTTEDIFNGIDSKLARKIPSQIWKIAARKLDMLNASVKLEDLRSPPANRLEKLKGRLSDYHSIRINDQFRVFFLCNSNAEDVQIIDYH